MLKVENGITRGSGDKRYWTVATDQVGLTGNKTGSFDFTTTGTAQLLGECQFGDTNTENHGINTAPVAEQGLTFDYLSTTNSTGGEIVTPFFIDGTMTYSGNVDNAAVPSFILHLASNCI